MKYTIEISYRTGSSFGSEDCVQTIEHEWSDMEVAKANLKRIKNHYEWSQEHIDLWHKPKVKLPEGVVWNDEYRMILLELLLDNGKTITASAFWTGHFEQLHEARVVLVDGSDELTYRPGY